MNILMPDDFVIHQVLNSLSIEYEQLKISYIALRDNWSIDELITVCVREEDKMNHEQAEKAHLTIAGLARKVITTIKGSSFYKETIRVTIKTYPVQTGDLRGRELVSF